MPTNDEIEDRLKQLAIPAKNYQSRTLGRQQAVTKLITEIEKYKNLNCPQTPNFAYANYHKVFAESQPK
jgi:hypothetical protein